MNQARAALADARCCSQACAVPATMLDSAIASPRIHLRPPCCLTCVLLLGEGGVL